MALPFDGLVEVEFKRYRRDGRLKLLDVNPRIWGWHTLGRRAGVDFPYLLWRMLNGAPVSPARGRPGVRWVRALTDVPTVLGALRAGELSFPAYLSSLRGPIEYAVLARDDPLPAIVELPSALHLAWVRRGRLDGTWALVADHGGDGADMIWRGAAAPAHHVQPSVIRETLQSRCQRFRRFREARRRSRRFR